MIVVGIIFVLTLLRLVVCCMVGVLITIAALGSLFMLILTFEFVAAAAAN